MPSSIEARRPRREHPDESFSQAPLRQVRILFVSFVKALFSEAPPGRFRYDDDEEKSEIIIRDENPIQVSTIGTRPAVNFTIGAVHFYSLGIDDMLGYDASTGSKTKGVLIPGTMSINVSARVDLEAHDLAFFIAERVWLQRDLFLRRGFFDLGRGNQVSPPSPAGSIVQNDQGDEWYVSTVSVPLQFPRKGAITPLNTAVIRNFEQRISTVLPLVESQGYPSTGVNGSYATHQQFPAPYALYATDARGRTPDPAGVGVPSPPLQPHPLNPSLQVTVRRAFPQRAGLRAPSIGGRALPLRSESVEESDT